MDWLLTEEEGGHEGFLTPARLTHLFHRSRLCRNLPTSLYLQSFFTSQHNSEGRSWNNINMYSMLPLIAVASLVGASIIQQPLINPPKQAPIGSYDSKPLVSSEALEAQITKDNLEKRAKELFKIAEEGIEEYNHPTRVIGSKGKLWSSHSWHPFSANTHVTQDTLPRSTTSIPPSQISATTTKSATNPLMPSWAMLVSIVWCLATKNPPQFWQ